jgi:hypothetical protein
MKKTIPNRPNNKLSCPHCGQTFQRAQALGGHIRYKHASTLAAKPTRPQAKEKEKKDNRRKAPALPVTTPAPTVPPAAPMPRAVPNSGAYEHLQTALQELTQRNHQIDEDLARLEGLQAEKEIIRKQIDAVNSALQAFAG